MNLNSQISSLNLIKKYKVISTTPKSKLQAIKLIVKFFKCLDEVHYDKTDIINYLGLFKQGGTNLFQGSSKQCSLLWFLEKELDLAIQVINYPNEFTVKDLQDALYSIIKNDSTFFKVKVTSSLSSLLLFQEEVQSDKSSDYSGYFFIIANSYMSNKEDFKYKLLTNLSAFYPNQVLLFTLASQLNKINLTASEMTRVSHAILDGRFGMDSDILTALAISLGKININVIDKNIQENIASAISCGKFGKDKNVLIALAKNLGTINIVSFQAQKIVILAILQAGVLSNDRDVLIALINSLSTMYIDFEIQKSISYSIFACKFGKDKEVLRVLAKSLGKIIFTNTIAQKYIAKAIFEGKFGNDSEVCRALATSLGTMKITSSIAQEDMAKAIYEGKFGAGKNILLSLAVSIGTINITNSVAQQYITKTIFEGKFGVNKDVLFALAKSIGTMGITCPDAQEYIALAISSAWFGKLDKDISIALTNSLSNMNITCPKAQKNIAEAILDGKLNSAHNLEDTDLSKLISIISNWVIKKDTYLQIFQKHNMGSINHIQFGQFINLDEVNIKEINGVNIEYCLDGLGAYGITYDINNIPELLIVYKENVSSQNSTDNIKERFNGFFNIDQKYSILYQYALSNIRVYSLVTEANYPALIEDLSINSLYFSKFPLWLQSKSHSIKFDVNLYQSAHILKFVLNDLLGAVEFTSMEVMRQCELIIQTVIKSKGNEFYLSINKKDDAKLKEKINDEFNIVDNMHKYLILLDSFWQRLTNNNDKLKLSFLLGQLAKNGALGYDYKGDNQIYQNQANECLYFLFEHCISRIIREGNANNTIIKIQILLRQRICINTLSMELINAELENNVTTVWELK